MTKNSQFLTKQNMLVTIIIAHCEKKLVSHNSILFSPFFCARNKKFSQWRRSEHILGKTYWHKSGWTMWRLRWCGASVVRLIAARQYFFVGRCMSSVCGNTQFHIVSLMIIIGWVLLMIGESYSNSLDLIFCCFCYFFLFVSYLSLLTSLVQLCFALFILWFDSLLWFLRFSSGSWSRARSFDERDVQSGGKVKILHHRVHERGIKHLEIFRRWCAIDAMRRY